MDEFVIYFVLYQNSICCNTSLHIRIILDWILDGYGFHNKLLVRTCPLFLNLDTIAPATASSIFADSKTMNGAFPPNSSASRLVVDAHCLYNKFPTPVDPLKKWFINIP